MVRTEREVINDLITRYSVKHGVSESVIHTVINCESGYRPRAVGDAGYSRGLVQIHSKYWPEITDEMAFDPEFAISFLAKKLSENRGKLWTCYRTNYR